MDLSPVHPAVRFYARKLLELNKNLGQNKEERRRIKKDFRQTYHDLSIVIDVPVKDRETDEASKNF
jgi:hypothetical protein